MGKIEISDPKKFTCDSNGKLTIHGYVTLKREGESVAELDATFDFSKVPVEWHRLVLDWVNSSGVSLQLPISQKLVEPEKPKPHHAGLHGVFGSTLAKLFSRPKKSP